MAGFSGVRRSMARRGSSSSASSSTYCAVPELALEDYDPVPDEELICIICRSVLREPVECHCRHVFCLRCITEWVRKNNNCPVCHKRAVSFQPALPLIRNMINRLKVKCRNAGCNARVPAESFAAHLTTCEYHEVSCPHEACEHRCLRHLLESHVKECPLHEVVCENGCGMVLTRDRLGTHSCVCELKRKLDEATSECDDWKRKAEDATKALTRLRDTLRRLGDTAVGLETNVGDLKEQLRSADALMAARLHVHHSTEAVRTSLRHMSMFHNASEIANSLSALTAPLFEDIESGFSYYWGARSDGTPEPVREVEELIINSP